MKVVVLQSGYIPWLGFFDLVNQADVFVFHDDLQWTKQDWRNRNRIRTPQGWSWLTVPVKQEKPQHEYTINEVEINSSQNWQKNHLAMLKSFYKKASYFDEIWPLLESVLTKSHQFIIDLNYELIFALCNYMDIKNTRFLFTQEMNINKEARKTERLISIFEELGGVTTYISGPAAKAYLEEAKVKEKGIKVDWHDYHHPYYNQNTWGSNVFIPYLSVVDLLFNHGKESLSILSGQKKIDKPVDIQVVLPDEYKEGARR